MLQGKRIILAFIVILLAYQISYRGLIMYKNISSSFPTETFIERSMKNLNGTLATYVKETEMKDEDHVQGREALSESLGLWMQFAIEKGDEELFTECYSILRLYFLSDEGMVYWRLSPAGEVLAEANASIDDLRIAHALLQAAALWEREDFLETGKKIGMHLNARNKQDRILADFYDKKSKKAGKLVTYSYIDFPAIQALANEGALDREIVMEMEQLLTEVPVRNGFFAKAYQIDTGESTFDQEVNMIDQMLIALHRSQAGLDSPSFLAFIKKELKEHGVIYARYEADSKKQAVPYESPALYALAILYAIEEEEENLAAQLYIRMTEFREDRIASVYYGGYTIAKDGNTHIFDNLLPLIAETRFKSSRSGYRYQAGQKDK
jgi:hypothetical protein